MAAKTAVRGIGAKKKDAGPVRLYTVVNSDGYPVYGTATKTEEGLRYNQSGTDLYDAVRLAKGLITPGGVAIIGPDGCLYGGRVDGEDTFEPEFTPSVELDFGDEE